MFRITRMGLVGFGLGAALLAAGCASDNKPPQSTLEPSTQGVMCTKCEATWVKVPVENGKGRIISYRTQKKMVCPDCNDAVQSFFATGKLQHTCKTCGDSMEICEAH